MTDQNTNNQGGPPSQMDIIMRERLATLEANQQFHRDTLAEISSSLREVVRTQSMLTAQKGDISR